jgi:polar amino acid transport system substrate-binding protein
MGGAVVKRRLLVAGLLVLFVSVSSCSRTPKTLRWAADADGGLPYVFRDPADPGKYIGFEMELKEALARELHRDIEFVPYNFKNIEDGLARGDFDFAMNGYEITPERRRLVLFSRPYYVYKLQLVVRDGDDRFRSYRDCVGKPGIKIGTLSGSAAERLLDKDGVPKSAYDDQDGPFNDLDNKRIDGVLLDLPIMIYYARDDPGVRYAQRRKGLRFVGEPFDPGYYAIAVAKGNEELLGQLNAALGRLIDDGTLKAIYTKWHIWNDDQESLKNLPQQDLDTGPAQERSFWGYLEQLLGGAWLTIQISFAGMALAILLGLPIALCRLYGPAPLRWLATAYVEFFRGIPVLLLLLFVYFGLPVIGRQYGLPFPLSLSAWWAAVITFGMNYAAYEAEIYRAGIGAIPAGQWEAAASLGMSNAQTFRHVILPQSIRTILPPMTNDFIALFKDTSVVSVIALQELTKRYQEMARSGAEVALLTAALYLIMSLPLGYLSRYLERRWGAKG